MTGFSKKAAKAAAFVAISIAMAMFAAPFGAPLVVAAMTSTLPRGDQFFAIFYSGDPLGGYLTFMSTYASSAIGLKALAIWVAVFAGALCAVAAMKAVGTPARNVEGGVLGDARLVKSRAELLAKNDFWNGKGVPSKAGLVLGSTKRGYYFDAAIPHFAVVGKTGAGKTMLLVVQSAHLLMAAGWNIIMTGKEELLQLTGEKAVGLGYERVILDLKGYPGASKFNPLDVVIDAVEAGDMAEAQRSARQIAADLIPLGSDANAYFSRAARNTLQACILVVVTAGIPKGWKNMASVCNLVNMGTAGGDPKDPSRPLKNMILDLGPEHPAFAAASDFLMDGGVTTAGKNVLSTLKDGIAIFNDEGIRRMTAASDVPMGDIVRKKSIVYMHMLEEDDPYLAIFTVFVNQYWRTAQRVARENAGRLPRETAIVGDEWGNMPIVRALPEMVTLGRSMRLHVYCFVQDLKQLNKYNKPGDQNAGRDKLLGSMGGKVVLSLAAPDDFEWFSRLAGKRTIRRLNQSRTRGGFMVATSASDTYSESAEDLIRPWEWQSRIPSRDGVVAIKGGEISAPGREGVFCFPASFAPNTPAGEFFGLGDRDWVDQKQADFILSMAHLLPASAGEGDVPCWVPEFPDGGKGGSPAVDDDWSSWDDAL